MAVFLCNLPSNFVEYNEIKCHYFTMKKFYKFITLFTILSICTQAIAQTDISKIDPNFAVEKCGDLNVVYINALEKPFSVEGFAWRKSGGALKRLPESVKENDISKGVYVLSNHTAGGVVRFRTDSPHITLRAVIRNRHPNMGHMPQTGSSGFDLFVDQNTYLKTVNPMFGKSAIPEQVEVLLTKRQPKKMRNYSLYLPLYNGVNKLEIGLAPDAKIEAPTPHKIKKPILFYGSSITQGGCASRPSNAYCAMLCRELDAPMINLAFSGNAKGEEKIAELIASLDLSVFVYDYDFNAPNAKHLWDTHEKFFKIIREKRPNLPIIMFSRIVFPNKERTDAVKNTYTNAIKNGDKLVWFMEGKDLVKGADGSYITVDGVHPNDLGFYLMYQNALPLLKEALKAQK